jgi:rhodanese-related sulfurtransferase
MNPLITLPELAKLTETEQTVHVLDVRLPEDFASGHLPDAINHCVFEVVFLEHVRQAIPDQSQSIIIVGWGGVSMEAEVALEKLQRAGFTSAQILQGGIETWKAAGLTLDVVSPTPPPPVWPIGRRQLDLEKCSVEWLGRNLLSKHWGQLPISAGYLDFDEKGPVCGGHVEFDLRGMTCTDLAGTPLHDVLIHHLLSDDFFDVERFPLAILEITGSTRIAETPGALNLEVRGDLTLRGVTQNICFLAAAGLTPEGLPAAQAALAIDRTRWGITYGSGKLFRKLAGHLVNDRFELQVKLETLKSTV